jgi:multiple sugar transport system permease protein
VAGETLEPTQTDEPTIPWNRLPVSKETLIGYASVLPVLILYFIIAIGPVAYAVNASFHEVFLLNPQWEWAGLQNYYEVFELETFWGSLWRGIIYMVGSTLIQLGVGLWLALALNKIARGQKFLTAVVFTAYLIPTIVLAFAAGYMFTPNIGLGVLQSLGSDFGLWAGNTAPMTFSQTWAMPLLILVGTWKFGVFITIFALAQLRAIPDRFYEAAQICGANRLQMFRDITLPRIQGVILVAVLLRSIFMFNKFDIIWVLTQGGPGSATTTLPILAYQTAFTGGNYGLANALAVVMFLFLGIGAVAYFILFNPSEEVETST